MAIIYMWAFLHLCRNFLGISGFLESSQSHSTFGSMQDNGVRG